MIVFFSDSMGFLKYWAFKKVKEKPYLYPVLWEFSYV